MVCRQDGYFRWRFGIALLWWPCRPGSKLSVDPLPVLAFSGILIQALLTLLATYYAVDDPLRVV